MDSWSNGYAFICTNYDIDIDIIPVFECLGVEHENRTGLKESVGLGTPLKNQVKLFHNTDVICLPLCFAILMSEDSTYVVVSLTTRTRVIIDQVPIHSILSNVARTIVNQLCASLLSSECHVPLIDLVV